MKIGNYTIEPGGYLYAYDHGKIRKRLIVSVENDEKSYGDYYVRIKCKGCMPYVASKYCIERHGTVNANSQCMYVDKENFLKWLNITLHEHTRLYNKYHRRAMHYESAMKRIEQALENV